MLRLFLADRNAQREREHEFKMVQQADRKGGCRGYSTKESRGLSRSK